MTDSSDLKGAAILLCNMTPGMVPQEPAEGYSPLYRYIVLLVALIVSSGIIVSWLGGQGILPINPAVALGLTILIATIVICCAAVVMQGAYVSRIVNYGELELRFEEGKAHFDNQEWENALLIFTELAGPKMDHKRAAYYSACCYEKLGNWENVKKYTKAYLRMKPRDAEAWEMLARSHKSLFEYEEAQHAHEQAEKFMTG